MSPVNKNSYDVIVLGAGIVGTCTALSACEAGLKTLLVDRREPGQETSSGNAGLVEDVPHPMFSFPRAISEIVRTAVGLKKGVRTELNAVPGMLGWLTRYWSESSSTKRQHADAALRSLTRPATKLHKHWAEAAGFKGFRENGILQVFEGAEDSRKRDQESRDAKRAGIVAKALSAAELNALEPAFTFDGTGLLWADGASVDRPGNLVRSYAELFKKRGGHFTIANAEDVERKSHQFFLHTSEGEITAPKIVIALGPWSADLTRRFRYQPPFALKRGYSATYELDDTFSKPERPIIFHDGGFVMSPVKEGVRLMSGVEFARAGTPPLPYHIDAVERDATKSYSLLKKAKRGPVWMGSRPCVPDMIPLIGPIPGEENVILATAHNHWGLTGAPATAQIVTDLLQNRTPSIDPTPFDPARF